MIIINAEVEINITMADLRLQAAWATDSTYDVYITDTSELPSDKQIDRRYVGKWTALQLGAVLALLAPFEDENYEQDETLKALYTIAEEVCKNLPHNLRPIP